MIEFLLFALLLVSSGAALGLFGQLWRLANAVEKWNRSLEMDDEETCDDPYCEECGEYTGGTHEDN